MAQDILLPNHNTMRILPFLALLAGSLSLSLPVRAQWVLRGLHQVHNDGNLTGHGDVLFGSSDLDGMTRSYDAGATWEPLPSGPDEARACIHDGTYILVGTSTGILRSADDGDTWESANGTIPASGTNWVFRFRLVNEVLFAVMSGNMNSGGGIYRSADHGTTWTSCNTGLSGSFSRVRDLVSVNGDLYCGLALNVYRSTDMGSTWTAMNDEGDTPVSVMALGVVGNRLLASVFDFGNILYSDDQGVTWTEADCSSQGSVDSSIEPYSGDLYALQYVEVHRSEDNGATWSIYHGGLDTEAPYRLSRVGPTLYLSAGSKLFVLDGFTGSASLTAALVHMRYDQGLLLLDRPMSGTTTVQVYDAVGRCVLERSLSGGRQEIPANLRSGSYSARLIAAGDNHLVTARFVVP